MTLPQKTEAKHLRSICHYGNKVARPFFFLFLFLLRVHYLMQMRPLMRPFCWVAHAGTSSTKGIYCLPASTPDSIQDVETHRDGFQSCSPNLKQGFLWPPVRARMVSGMRRSLNYKGPTVSPAGFGPLSQIHQYLEPSRRSGHPQHDEKETKCYEKGQCDLVSGARPQAASRNHET